MVNVKTQVIINRPIKVVSEYASNPDNTVKWYKNIKSAGFKLLVQQIIKYFKGC